jgi:hypothetical protein
MAANGYHCRPAVNGSPVTPSASTARAGIPGSVWLLTVLCVLIGVLGLAAGWTGAALLTRQQCGWIALVAAVDAAIMLRLANFPSGQLRAALSLGMTLVAIALANYFIVAARLGARMGIEPSESVRLLSLEMAWLLAGYANSVWDLVLIGIAAVLAWWWGR